MRARVKLFDCQIDTFGESKFKINTELEEPYLAWIISSLDRAGQRLPYQCELYPSTESQQGERFAGMAFSYSDDIDQAIRDRESFQDWFLRWLDTRILVPDTCVVLEHYLTSVLLPRLSSKIQISVPRFVLLELESIGNRKAYDKRLAFSAFNEIRNLRLNHDATTFTSPITADLLANFANISSRKGADSFIRYEMRREMERIDAMDTRYKQMVLITRDLIMACTASAENIDTFYLSSSMPSRKQFYKFNISKIITELAVSFGEIIIEDFVDDHSLVLKGMWSGKDIIDWQNENLQFRVIPHETAAAI
ncbi:hypothetical protein ES703_114301 [subsurface metagenome]